MRPDNALVAQLTSMGFPQNRAIKALVRTHNCGVEQAVNWLMEHTSDPDIDAPVDRAAVLVVSANLLMTTGKVASQCAHAAVGLYKVMMANRVPWYPAFEAQGEKTVVVSAESGEQLEELADLANQLLLPTFLVADAGRTQVLPGSVTVLAIAGPAETVDKVTGDLKLLR